MTTQIAVRLPDELVDFVDKRVERGLARSRAGVIEQALKRELRREIAARDAAILANAGPDPDLDALAAFASDTPMDELD
jgi:Arc/MetJ-type ribon-helix-helix transcriptional regulator